MMYTVGDKEVYDKGLVKPNVTFMKRGADELYEGGIAFINFHDAKSWIFRHGLTESYSVYGLDCSKENTYWGSKSRHLCLLGDALIIKLDESGVMKLSVIQGGKE